MQAEYLAHAPSNSVPHDCIAQRFLDAHSEAISRQAISPRKNHKITPRAAPALTINRLVFRPPQEPPFARQITLLRWLIRGLSFGHKGFKRASTRAALWRGAAPALCGHSWSSFANGSRASYDADEHVVEKCASATNPLLNKQRAIRFHMQRHRLQKTSVCEPSSLCEVTQGINF